MEVIMLGEAIISWLAVKLEEREFLGNIQVFYQKTAPTLLNLVLLYRAHHGNLSGMALPSGSGLKTLIWMKFYPIEIRFPMTYLWKEICMELQNQLLPLPLPVRRPHREPITTSLTEARHRNVQLVQLLLPRKNASSQQISWLHKWNFLIGLTCLIGRTLFLVVVSYGITKIPSR